MRFWTISSAISFAWMQILSANSSNPPDGYHGETLNCSSCHSGSSVNSGDGGINLSGLPSNYTPGQTYDLSITVSGTQTNGYGFQLIPKANGSVSGNLSSASADLGIQSNALEHRGTSSSGPGAGDHRISPSKSASLGRPSRPRTAPPNRHSIYFRTVSS